MSLFVMYFKELMHNITLLELKKKCSSPDPSFLPIFSPNLHIPYSEKLNLTLAC